MSDQESIAEQERDDQPFYRTFTVQEGVELLGWGKFQWHLLFQTGCCWAADSMEMMVLSFIVPMIADEWGLTGVEKCMISVATFVGIMLGNELWGVLSDKYGRRIGYLGSVLTAALFGIGSALVPDDPAMGYPLLLISRGLVGVGIGGAHVAFSLFAEYVPNKQRGMSLIAVEGVFWSAGALISAALAWVMMPHVSLGWRWYVAVSTVPLFLLLCSWPWLPESAYYLQASGRPEAAKRALVKAARVNGSRMSTGELELPTKLAGTALSKLLGGLQLRPFSVASPTMLQTTLLLWCIWAANTFTYYGVVFLIPLYYQEGCALEGGVDESDGCAVNDPKIYQGAFVTTFAEMPGLVVATLLVDPLGRKKTLALLFLLTAVAIAPILLQRAPEPEEVMPTLQADPSSCPVGFNLLHLSETTNTILLFIARGAINGAFTVTYVYTPEVYPTAVRSTGLGTCSAVARLAGMATSCTANTLCVVHAWGAYSLCALVAAVLSILLPIETSKKDLPDTFISKEPQKPIPPLVI